MTLDESIFFLKLQQLPIKGSANIFGLNLMFEKISQD